MAIDLLFTAQQALRQYLRARGVRSEVQRIRGQQVHCYTLDGTGSGPPVVLVHGLGGSANGFYRLFHGLAKRFRRVIAPDLPGHGFSPLPATGPLALTEQLAILVELFDTRVGEPALVIGNSLGGAMALRLASERPQRVRALALVAPAGARMTDEGFDALAKAMRVRTTEDARALTRRLFAGTPIVALLAAPVLRNMYGTPAVLATFAEVRGDHVKPEELAALKMPLLLLWGGSEKLLPADGIDYFRAHLPKHAEIEVVPGFGHVPQVERPAEVLRRLISFADAHAL